MMWHKQCKPVHCCILQYNVGCIIYKEQIVRPLCFPFVNSTGCSIDFDWLQVNIKKEQELQYITETKEKFERCRVQYCENRDTRRRTSKGQSNFWSITSYNVFSFIKRQWRKNTDVLQNPVTCSKSLVQHCSWMDFSLRTICFEQCYMFFHFFFGVLFTDCFNVYHFDHFVYVLRAVFDFEHE